MNLTPENRATIDTKTIIELLDRIRFAPAGDPWFQGETGDYWLKRYSALKNADPGAAVAASKTLGWEKR
jgi:hypothetical protein